MGFFKTVKRGIEREHIKQRLKTSERKRYKEEVRAEEKEAYKKEELKQAKVTGTSKAKRAGKKAREPKKGFGGFGFGLRPGLGKGASPLGATSFMEGGFTPSGMTSPSTTPSVFGGVEPKRKMIRKRKRRRKRKRK